MTDKPWKTGLTSNDILTLFDANTILAADTDDTPAALSISEANVVGRATGGNIASLTKAQIWTIMEDYLGFYQNDNATATTIQAANQWHLLLNFSSAQSSANWNFTAGASKSITAYADNGDSKTQVSSSGHGMSNGNIVSIAGTTNYNGVWVIEQVATDTFVINTAYVADDGASTGILGDTAYSSDSGSTGKYLVAWSMSVTPGNSNDVIEVVIYQNATAVVSSENQVKLGTANDYTNIAGMGIVDYTNGDYITLAVQNLSGGNNFTVRDANVVITRVGT